VAVRRRVLLALAVLVAAWLVGCAVLFVWPPAETGVPARADVVVMLSGSHERLARAEQLIRQGVAPVLALSSVQDTPRWQAAKALCRAGVYAGARVLCFQASPYSTQGEAEAIGRLARQQHWNRVVVVSSTYHLTRAKLLIDRCYRGPLWLVGAASTWWKQPEQWAFETGKILYQLTIERSC